MIRVETLTDGIEKEIDRLTNGPTMTDFMRFESVLASQYQATQGAVHVITGSLKLSGKVDSNFTNTRWSGQITYGGTSEGIHNPVDYAEYERERDGDHDFLAPADRLAYQYVDAMRQFLEG